MNELHNCRLVKNHNSLNLRSYEDIFHLYEEIHSASYDSEILICLLLCDEFCSEEIRLAHDVS